MSTKKNVGIVAASGSVAAAAALLFSAIDPGPAIHPDLYCLAGIPASTNTITMLANQGYMAGYSESRGSPLWVCYRLDKTDTDKAPPRPSGFKADNRTESRINSDDYTNTGYDRGHMAPNYGIGLVYGAKAQRETFLMSNVIPQKPALNQGLWRNLEASAVLDLAREKDGLWVITGPVYTTGARIAGTDRRLLPWTKKSVYTTGARIAGTVEIPAACYKILVWDEDGLHAAAFMVPQGVDRSAKAQDFKVSIDEIEAATGFDFFAGLPDEVENELEGKP